MIANTLNTIQLDVILLENYSSRIYYYHPRNMSYIGEMYIGIVLYSRQSYPTIYIYILYTPTHLIVSLDTCTNILVGTSRLFETFEFEKCVSTVQIKNIFVLK